MPSLIVVARTRSEEIPLQGNVAVIGRDAGVTFELSDFKVSRRHALLVRTAEGFFVKDLGSRNGVFLNQRRVASRDQSRLKNGDVLQVGSTTLIFKDLQGEPADAGEVTRTRPDVIEAAALRASDATPSETGGGAPAEGTAGAPAATPGGAAPPRPAPAGPVPGQRAVRPAPAARRPGREIPRALPPRRPAAAAAPGSGAPHPAGAPHAPGAPSRPGDPHAELLLARALERAERERTFLRNLCLVLLGLLGLTLAWLLASALREPAPPTAAVVAPTAGPAPTAPAPAARLTPASAFERLDRARFAGEVQPVLAARCAGCHSFLGRGGDLLLAASSDPATLEANFAAAARFVRVEGPERSPLLLKALPPDEGGLPHGAGAIVLHTADPDWQALRAWALDQRAPTRPEPAAVTTAVAPAEPRPRGPNAAPQATIAEPGAALVGAALALDAGGSRDPDGDELHFRWLLVRRPDDSAARLSGGDGARVELTPDVAGDYEVAVVVHDGTDSARAGLTLHAGLPRSDPGREAALRRALERLTGRAPEPEQLAALLPLERGALVQTLLERPELYERWWLDELAYLLDGPARPQGEPWDSMPARLREGRVGVQDVHFALAVGRDWSGRWAGKQAWVSAVLERLLGLDPAAAQAERAAAERMYDGYESQLLGQKGSSQADLVRIATRDERARAHALRSAWRRVTGAEPEPAALSAALTRWQAEPQAFFRILAEAACRDLGP